jgi:hypothetical protein
MFQIFLQMTTYVFKQVTSLLLLESNFMFLPINQQVSKKLISNPSHFVGAYLFFMDDNAISGCI